MSTEYPELPETNKLLEQYPYDPFDDPAANIAERLIALAHLTFNADVWAKSPERRKRYWKAFLENVEGGANTNRLSVWWNSFTEGMASNPFNSIPYLHEKNQLLDPIHLSTPVDESLVLDVLRTQSAYLVDRARVWVKIRGAAKKQVPDTDIEMEKN